MLSETWEPDDVGTSSRNATVRIFAEHKEKMAEDYINYL